MAFWIALAVLLVAVVAGIAYVVVRGLQLWRDAKRSGATITAEMERISEATLQIERHDGEGRSRRGPAPGRDRDGSRRRGRGSTSSSPPFARRVPQVRQRILVHPGDLTAAGRSPRNHR